MSLDSSPELLDELLDELFFSSPSSFSVFWMIVVGSSSSIKLSSITLNALLLNLALVYSRFALYPPFGDIEKLGILKVRCLKSETSGRCSSISSAIGSESREIDLNLSLLSSLKNH
jgi:hypothetical protein